MKILFFLLIFFLFDSLSFANCVIYTSAGKPIEPMSDAISMLLSSSKTCPKNVFEFREKIKTSGLTIDTTMVANRGFHNPAQGSFSFFEIVSGKLNSIIIQPSDFFFGHFTKINAKNEIDADQTPSTKLMIEAFAWDVNKEIFNFYELIGGQGGAKWFIAAILLIFIPTIFFCIGNLILHIHNLAINYVAQRAIVRVALS